MASELTDSLASRPLAPLPEQRGPVFERVRELSQLGELVQARLELQNFLAGSATELTQLKTNIKIRRRATAPDPVSRLQAARWLLALSDLNQSHEQLAAGLSLQLQQLPVLAQSPEALLLQAYLAWQRGQAKQCQHYLDASRQAGFAMPDSWVYAPFHQQLAALLQGLLAVLNGDEPEFQVSSQWLLEHPSLLLQWVYACFVHSASPLDKALAEALENRLEFASGLLNLILQLQKSILPDLDSLAAQLHKPALSAYERLVVLRLLGALAAEQQILLLKQAVLRNPQPEWLYALGLAQLSQSRALALESWNRLYTSASVLPARLLAALAGDYLACGYPAQARRCLERALIASPGARSVKQQLQRLLHSSFVFAKILRLPLAPDWANGGDLAIKACFEAFKPQDKVLLQPGCDWDQPLLEQALNWFDQVNPETRPAIWCGELPAEWQELPLVRCLPWRLPVPESQLPAEQELEIQPMPEEPHLGPVYYLLQEPGRQNFWLESDPESLVRWLRAALWHRLPSVPLRSSLGLSSRYPAIALIIRQSERDTAALSQSFAEVVYAHALETTAELAGQIQSPWVLLLEAGESLDPAQLVYLKFLLHKLPAEIQAVALGGCLPDGQSWPALRLLRREALPQLAAGGFVCLLDKERLRDAPSWYLPEIKIQGASLKSQSLLDQAWQAYALRQYQTAMDFCRQAEASISHNQRLSALGLSFEILARQARWQEILESGQKLVPATARMAYWYGQALLASGRPAEAHQAFRLALACYDRLQPEVLDLLPALKRSELEKSWQQGCAC